MESSEAQSVDVDAFVKDQFRQYFGTAADLPLANQVIADAGVDSILLVMILTDMLTQLGLDASDARMKLRDIRTLEDVAALVRTLTGAKTT